MHCPKCGDDESKVIESRDADDSIRRRRECLKCGNRYTTYERLERPNLTVVKRDKRRELFDRDKLKRAVYQSVGKFLNGEIEVEEIVNHVEESMYSLGELEIASKQIGDAVMSELARRNEVAYIRFASVYREFKNADEFVQTLKELRQKDDDAPAAA
ncbi:transcriptional regulator NrdR [Candidatus Saccharibacteria bacterium]|nr:transcriptional regulator NrdR [Candidatus Saccharibacteria bacterium]